MWSRFKNRVFADRQRIRELGSFTAGMLAAKQGQPITNCPHKRKSRKKTAWLKGWRDGDVEHVCARICRRTSHADNE